MEPKVIKMFLSGKADLGKNWESVSQWNKIKKARIVKQSERNQPEKLHISKLSTQ